MYYEAVFRELDEKEVRYLVVGGIALNLHGVPRLTADLDIMVDLSEENVKKLITALENLGYMPKPPLKAIEFADPSKRKKWQEEKGRHVFSFFHPKKPFEAVDIFVENPIPFELADKEKNVVEAGKIKILVVSIKHLIKLKQLASRKQDLSDIEALTQVMRLHAEKD